MSEATIGIKIADGSFYPILPKESEGRKKLVLTTVKDDQSSVQIDLYEADGGTIDDGRYIGSLLVDNIAPAPKGNAEIELIVGVDKEGKLSARAREPDSGESQSLSVSLRSLSEDSTYDVPEFELGEDFEPWEPGSEDETEEAEVSEFEETEVDRPSEPAGADEELAAKRRPVLLALIIIVGIAVIVALAILFYTLLMGPTVPPLEAKGGAVQTVAVGDTASATADSAAQGSSTARPDAVSGSGSGSQTDSPRDGPAAGTASSAASSPSSENAYIGGVWYWIRWGDTLWDISSSFYRTPWLYGTIASQNSIRNPDYILAGSKIFIPRN